MNNRSRSEGRSRKVPLVVEAPDATTEIFLMDGDFNRVGIGVSRLELDVHPGLYKVRFRSGGAMRDHLIDVAPELPAFRFMGTPIEFRSSVPLVDTLTSPATHVKGARDTSGSVHDRPGTGCELFVFIRNLDGPWAISGVSIRDSEGHLISDFERGDADPEEGWAAINLEVDPGTYRLRVETEPLGVYEMFVVACPDWQSQVFINVQELREREARVHRPGLRSASILMSRRGLGFRPDSPDARLADLARLGLQGGRNVISKSELASMLAGKFENPMLGLYAGHLLLREHRPDRALLADVCRNLDRLIGPHPDTRALALETPGARKASDEFAIPPMLRGGWNLVVKASRRRRGLVVKDSLMDRVSDGLIKGGVWVLWRLPAHELTRDGEVRAAVPSASRAEARDWVQQLMGMTADLGESAEQSVSVSQSLAALTSLDQSVLRSIQTQAFQFESDLERPTAARLESDLSRQLGVPTVSVGRSIRRLASNVDTSRLRKGFISEEG